jgi:hypothetical protein
MLDGNDKKLSLARALLSKQEKLPLSQHVASFIAFHKEMHIR